MISSLNRILWIMTLLMLPCLSATARQEAAEEATSIPDKTKPPTPQAAMFMRYGEYPVGLTTGVPDISIPLYDIELTNYTLPISISYHAAGNKPSDVASCVGLGWVLNAGGMVARSINGSADLKYEMPRQEDTLYYSCDRVKAMRDIKPKNAMMLTELAEHGSTSSYDTQSDRYVYNMSGKSGVLRYSYKDNKYVALNHEPLYIKAKGGDDSYFYMVDGDGVEYDFIEKEYVGVFNDENTTDVSSWYLTEIRAKNDTIRFKYAQAEDFRTYSYNQTTRFDWRYLPEGPDYKASVFDIYNSTRYLNRQKLLTEIEWRGNKVMFIYNNNREDICHERLVNMRVVANDGSVVKDIYFDNNQYLGTDSANYRMLLRGLDISKEGVYSFDYDMRTTLPDYEIGVKRPGVVNALSTDYWGYYNAHVSKSHVPKSVFAKAFDNLEGYEQGQIQSMLNDGADRDPDEIRTQAGILNKIIYPTGGSTTFKYSLNYYSANHKVGGLCVDEISNYDINGRLLGRTSYSYAGTPTQDDTQLAMYYYDYHYHQNGTHEPFVIRGIACVSNPILPTYNSNGSPVFYSHITERHLDGSKTFYYYSDGNINNNMGLYDEWQHASLWIANTRDEGNSIPLLLEKKRYDKDGNLLEQVTNEYETLQLSKFEMGTTVVNLIQEDKSDYVYEMHCNDAYIKIKPMYAYSKLSQLLKSVTVDYTTGTTTTESYTYDPEHRTLLPKTKTVSNGDGQDITTVAEYAFERSEEPYKDMYNNYMFCNEPISEKEYVNGVLTSNSERRYGKFNENYFPIQSLSSIGNGPLFEDYRILDYDRYGNIKKYVAKCDTTSLVWGYNGCYPVAITQGYWNENAGFQSADLIKSLEACTNNDILNSRLTSLRNTLTEKGIKVRTLLYKPLLGICKDVDFSGYTLYYDYHPSGSLHRVRDHSGTIRDYNYQYAHPSNK